MHPVPAEENENKALIRRWFEEVWNGGRIELVDELRAADTVATGLGEGDAESRGNAAFKTFYSNMRQAFPDLQVRIEDMIAEGDRVAVRATFEGTHMGEALGAAPTGRRVSFACIAIARIADGRIVQAWNSLDQLGILNQIGALPGKGTAGGFLTRRS
jgi:steroid delta-isomerase-like uncharacterized protein